MAFCLFFRGSLLKVEVTPSEATYELPEGPPLALAHHREVVAATVGEPLTLSPLRALALDL